MLLYFAPVFLLCLLSLSCRLALEFENVLDRWLETSDMAAAPTYGFRMW